MSINITTSRQAGEHTLTKTNANIDEKFIYFKNTGSEAIPDALVPGTKFIYTPGAGNSGRPSGSFSINLTGLSSGGESYSNKANQVIQEAKQPQGGFATIARPKIICNIWCIMFKIGD